MRRIIALLLLTLFASFAYAENVKLTVFPDGYVKVSVKINVTKGENVSISLPFYEFSNLSVTLNGKEIPFILGENKIVVYSSGDGTLEVTYITPELTEKHGKTWKVILPFNDTKEVVLPNDAVIVGLSGIPISIRDNAVIMPKGEQYIEYITPHIATSSSTGNNVDLTLEGILTLTSFALGLILGAYGSKIRILFSRGVTLDDLARKYNLNKEEQDVLLYILEQGGRVRQADIRNDLGIPRTTTWRILKRLEKNGLVRLLKINNETHVELRVKIKG